jgi:signal transduction histidine kinase
LYPACLEHTQARRQGEAMTDVAESSTARDPQPVPIPAPPLADARTQIDELTTALAGRDHLIAFVGHELRNALAPLLLLVDQFVVLAEDPRAAATMMSRAQLVTRNLRRVITAINWVTEVADLSRGALRLERSAGDLAQIARDVCREQGGDAVAHGAELIVETPAPVVGAWDRVRLKQIVGHLVSSAIRRAGGRVEVSVAGRGGDAELIVRDHGPRIEPSVLAQLFDPFDPERDRRPGGLGIGLWTVKMLTAMMRGSITIHSCADGGTCFCVVVPRG